MPPSLCLPLPTARPKGDLNEELAPLGVPAGGGQALARRRFGTQRREIPAATQEGGGHAGPTSVRREISQTEAPPKWAGRVHPRERGVRAAAASGSRQALPGCAPRGFFQHLPM